MDEKQRELDAVQAKYDQAMRDKQTLVDDAEACRRKMANATALIDGLGGEKTRWTEQSKKFDQQIQRCGSYWSKLFSLGRTSLVFGCVMYTCIRNWPLPIGAFQDQYKQIVINEHNKVKNPDWREADQLAIYKRRREVELGLPRTTSASGQNGI